MKNAKTSAKLNNLNVFQSAKSLILHVLVIVIEKILNAPIVSLA